MRKFAPNYFILDDRPSVEALFHTAAGKLQRSAERFLDIIYSAGCQCVVVEDEYVDLDFKAGYGRFYYLHHRDTHRRCKRAHFFSTRVRQSDLYQMRDATKDALLAYCVIRPLPSNIVGRTVINESVMRLMYKHLYSGEQRYITCKAHHEINLAGNSVSFLGVPWMQQDRLVAACASAAIWTANWHMCHLYQRDFKRYTTPQITDLAVRFSMTTGRAMPSGGLTVEQMISALKAMGYEPFLRNPRTAFEGRRTIYHYIESGIPVIAIIAYPPSMQRHAITIVGHTLKMATPTVVREGLSPEEHEAYTASTCDFVPRFIAQDDSSGPFRFIELLDWANVADPLLDQTTLDRYASEFACFVAIDRSEVPPRRPDPIPPLHFESALLEALLVPVPLRVTLDGVIAEYAAVKAIEKFWPSLDRSKLIVRTFIQPSNNLKRWWDPRFETFGRPAEVGFHIRPHSLPNWVWVTEFADRDSLVSGHSEVLGQIIQDSSGRGSGVDLTDDILAMIGPSRIVLISADPKIEPLEAEGSFTHPITQYRVGEYESERLGR